MSAPVDVLAVMDAAHATFDNLRHERRNNDDALRQSMHWSARIDEMIKARAAIAELIEADKEYDAAEQECVDHHRPLFKRGKEWSERQSQIEARCDAAIARRSAALAAVSPK